MKYLLFSFLISMSSLCYGQDITCFENETQAKDFVSGYWKQKDLQTTQFHKIVFSGNKGRIETLESMDLNSERNANKYDLVFNEKHQIVIEKEANCYTVYLEINAIYGSTLSSIIKVNDNAFMMDGKAYVRYNIND